MSWDSRSAEGVEGRDEPVCGPDDRVTAEGCATALRGLPDMTPHRLRRLIIHEGRCDPFLAWERVREGRFDKMPRTSANVISAWRRAATRCDLAAVSERVRASGQQVLVFGRPEYPARLVEDAAAPAVLFAVGDLSALDAGRRTVAIVGTRNCSGYGRGVAQELGRQLAEEGVVVVSGMAEGIDSAAQVAALGPARNEVRRPGGDAPEGAVEEVETGGRQGHAPVAGVDQTESGDHLGRGPVVGVAGTGLDRVYPMSSRVLWRRIGASGLLLSELAPGEVSSPWAFAQRNRIIAALADVVVVVEAFDSGGALGTADQANRRGRTVMAVPGAVTAWASAGTNALIADGCPPARDVMDVRVALSLVPDPGPRRRTGFLPDRSRARVPQPAWKARRSPRSPGDYPDEDLDRAESDNGAQMSWWTSSGFVETPAGAGVRREATVPLREATEAEAKLLAQVDATPTSLEVLLARTGMRPGLLALALDELEQAGLVEAGAGWWARPQG